MMRDATPAGEHEPLAGSLAFEEVVCLSKGCNRKRHILVAAGPVRAFILPEPHVIDHGVALEEIAEAAFEKVSRSARFDKAARMRKGFRRQCLNDLSRILIRLKANAGADAEFAGKFESSPHHGGGAVRDVPVIGGKPGMPLGRADR